MPEGARMKGETKPKAKGSTSAVHYSTPTKENCRCGHYYCYLACSNSSSILRIIASESLNISRPNAWCLLVGFFFLFFLSMRGIERGKRIEETAGKERRLISSLGIANAMKTIENRVPVPVPVRLECVRQD